MMRQGYICKKTMRLINRIHEIINDTPGLISRYEIYNILVSENIVKLGKLGYDRIEKCILKHFDKSLFRDGRESNGKCLPIPPPKFQVGDKVRIKRNNKRTPKYITENIRIDNPRTVVKRCRVSFKQGYVYFLGNNKQGCESLEPYGFLPRELIPFVKGGLGRPKRKRVYKYRNQPQGVLSSILVCHQAL